MLVESDGFGDILGRVAKLKLETPQKRFVGCRIAGAPGDLRLAFAGEPQLQRASDIFDDFVLKGEHAGPCAIEALGPDIAAGLGVDQLRVDAHLVGHAAGAALEDVAHAEFLVDLCRRYNFALVAEGGVTRDNKEARHIRKLCGQILGNSVGEVALLCAIAQIGKGQYDE